MVYDTSFICTYKMGTEFDEEDRNTLYQIQLLNALQITAMNDETILDQRINDLYNLVEEDSSVLESMKQNPYYENYKDSPLVIFKMMFSYDEFDKFHKVLCSIFPARKLLHL